MAKRTLGAAGELYRPQRRMGTIGAVAVAVLATGMAAVGVRNHRGAPGRAGAALASRLGAHYLKLPLLFESNVGQTDARVRFLCRGSGYTLFLARDEAVLGLRKPESRSDRAGDEDTNLARRLAGAARRSPASAPPLAVLRMKLVGSGAGARLEGLERFAGSVNYFLGRSHTRWRSDVPAYGAVIEHGVWPGVDLVYHGSQRQVECDFIVAAGADLKAVKLAFAGADRSEVDARGDLVLYLGAQQVRLLRPSVYQEVNGVPRRVRAAYKIFEPAIGASRAPGSGPWNASRAATATVGFQVEGYDRGRPLVVDPVLSYSSYLGGAGAGSGLGDSANAIAVDASGNAYVTGRTVSAQFPVLNGAQTACPACSNGEGEAFVTKLNPSASGSASMVYSSYLGGSGTPGNGTLASDAGTGIAVDSSGDAYVTGVTSSSDFPTTAGALQKTCKACPANGTSAFVTELSPTWRRAALLHLPRRQPVRLRRRYRGRHFRRGLCHRRHHVERFSGHRECLSAGLPRLRQAGAERFRGQAQSGGRGRRLTALLDLPGRQPDGLRRGYRGGRRGQRASHRNQLFHRLPAERRLCDCLRRVCGRSVHRFRRRAEPQRQLAALLDLPGRQCRRLGRRYRGRRRRRPLRHRHHLFCRLSDHTRGLADRVSRLRQGRGERLCGEAKSGRRGHGFVGLLDLPGR